jgi:TRAP-type C4-dicarboxylate transport system permease small subunit
MALVFGVIFFNSLRRYTIGKSFEWGEELPIYLTAYGIMLGSALAYLQDRHIRFSIVTDLLTSRQRNALLAMIDVLMTGTGIVLAYSGWLFVLRRGGVEASGVVGTAKDLAAATGLTGLEIFGRMSAWQFSILLGGVVLALAAFLKFLTRMYSLRSDKA